MRARRSALALVSALALTLTACGSGGPNNGDKAADGSSSDQGAPSAEAIDINALPRDQVPQGGTLRWPLTEIPPNFNYNEIDGTLRDNADVIEALMPGVFRFG